MSKDAFKHVAPPPPAIIDFIRQRNFERLDAIVAQWDRSDSMDELRRALGVVGEQHRRRSQATVEAETAIARAIMSAALNGNHDPFAAVEIDTGFDAKRIQRAWEKWATLHLDMLAAIAQAKHPQFSDSARTAIAILKKPDTK